jgi:hypothetical protein
MDRYPIKRFPAARSGDLRSHVLEIGGDVCTLRFGGDRVSHSDVPYAADKASDMPIVIAVRAKNLRAAA